MGGVALKKEISICEEEERKQRRIKALCQLLDVQRDGCGGEKYSVYGR